MALSLFIKAMLDGEEIDVNGNGKMERDFTYIDDVVEGLMRLINKIPKKNDNFDKKDILPHSAGVLTKFSIWEIQIKYFYQIILKY